MAKKSAYAPERSQPGILESVIKVFYDSDKGGLRPGGILGLLAGGAAYYNMAQGAGALAGESSWVGLVGVAFGAALGAWAGNKGGDFLSGRMEAKSPGRSSPVKTPQQGITPQKMSAIEATPASEHHVSTEAIGNLSPSSPPSRPRQNTASVG